MIILGNGRVGGGLYRRAQRFSVDASLVGRTDGRELLREDVQQPILVCTNAGDLRELIRGLPSSRLDSLIFVQNGMIDPVLQSLDCGGCTRGLLYFAVPTRGAEIEPGGVSIFTGAHAEYVSKWFQYVELEAEVVTRESFSTEMASKLIWNCTFGLMCDVYQVSVGVLVEEHRTEVDALIAELCMVAGEGIGCALEPVQISADLCAYSLSIHGYRGALKQWEWRNGWFVDVAERMSLSTPIHARLLERQAMP